MSTHPTEPVRHGHILQEALVLPVGRLVLDLTIWKIQASLYDQDCPMSALPARSHPPTLSHDYPESYCMPSSIPFPGSSLNLYTQTCSFACPSLAATSPGVPRRVTLSYKKCPYHVGSDACPKNCKFPIHFLHTHTHSQA